MYLVFVDSLATVVKAQRLLHPFQPRILTDEAQDERKRREVEEEVEEVGGVPWGCTQPQQQSEIRHLLTIILARQGRRLPSRLWPYVLAKAAKEPTPFYLSLAARVICLHYDKPRYHQQKQEQQPQPLRDDLQLEAGVPGLVSQLVELLRGRHDAGLVDAALALVTFAPEGLSEVDKAVQLTRV